MNINNFNENICEIKENIEENLINKNEETSKISFNIEENKKEEEKKEYKEEKDKQKSSKIEDGEEFKIKCPLCFYLFYEPIKLPCQHTFCHFCLKQALTYDSRCPLCRNEYSSEEVEKIFSNPTFNKEIIELIKKKIPTQEIEMRKETFLKDKKLFEETPTIKVEYGNTSTKLSSNSKKFSWTLYVKILKSDVTMPIEYVEYDINPGVQGSKPIKVTSMPYELNKNTGFEFNCEIKVYWKKSLKLQPYSTFHRITLGPAKTSKCFFAKIEKLNKFII